ncbi:hypothetical protein [Stappia sp. ICDLI1TA098]|jgi:hypothetical protein
MSQLATLALIVLGTAFCAALFVLVAATLAGVASLTMGLRRQHDDETDLTPWQGRPLPDQKETDT